MTRSFARLVLIAGLAGTPLAAGCGGGDGSAGPVKEATAERALADLGEMLKIIAENKQKPPTKQSELDQHEPVAVVGVRGVVMKQIVYQWGAGYVPGGTKVVAYETKADTDGGYVLLEDGTVKKLSAAEFGSAPKAGKK